MSTILELREKRAKAWDAAKAFLDSKRSGSGLLSAEDTATYDRMEADVLALGKEVERMERQAAIDAELSKPTNTPITGKPYADSVGGGNANTAGRATDEYKRAFWDAIRNKLNPYEVQNALRIGADPEGGFLVPETYEQTLVEALEEENLFRRLARVIRTSGGDRKIPVASSKGTASWVDEGQLIPESDDSFGQISISAFKLATMIKVSEELINDSIFNIEAYIAKEFARRIGAEEENAFLNGTGVSQPTGIFNAVGGAPVGVTTASVTAVTLDEIMDLFYSLKAPYRHRATFVTSDAVMKIIRKMKDNNGQYIWQPAVTDATPDKIMNQPIVTSSFVPAIASGAKVMAFGDFGYFWVADRQGRTFKRLNELFAQTGQVGFLSSQRVDGKLVLPEAVQVMQIKA